MCNAHNHSDDCTCGFGGDGHLGKSTNNIFRIYRSEVFADCVERPSSGWLFYTDKKDSYVNPNARCPVCGAEVYFYKSPNEGKVYFDELGPPWPKHGCTINSENIYLKKKSPFRTIPNRRGNRSFKFKSNFTPYFIESIQTKSEKQLVTFRSINLDHKINFLLEFSQEVIENGMFAIKASDSEKRFVLNYVCVSPKSVIFFNEIELQEVSSDT